MNEKDERVSRVAGAPAADVGPGWGWRQGAHEAQRLASALADVSAAREAAEAVRDALSEEVRQLTAAEADARETQAAAPAQLEALSGDVVVQACVRADVTAALETERDAAVARAEVAEAAAAEASSAVRSLAPLRRRRGQQR